MIRIAHRVAWLCALAASPAAAKVDSASDAGFAVTSTVTIAATPAQVYAALGKPGQWWSSAHTWSGNARNMSLTLRPNGCFCETIPAKRGAAVHGVVVYFEPGKTLRLSAALGPLMAEGVSGALTWTLEPDGKGTRVTKTYVVGGYIRGGAKTFAPLVDRVIEEQLTRLKAFVEGRLPLRLKPPLPA